MCRLCSVAGAGVPSAGHRGWLAEECMLRVWCDGVCCGVAAWRGSKNGEFRCSREWWRRAGLLAGLISWQRHTGTQLTHAQCDQPGLAWAGLARAGWAGLGWAGLRKCRCWLVTAVELVASGQGGHVSGEVTAHLHLAPPTLQPPSQPVAWWEL